MPAFNLKSDLKELTEAKFYDVLVGNMTFKPKAVYKTAAFVAGLALKAMHEKEAYQPSELFV